jgi:hypothetical protein
MCHKNIFSLFAEEEVRTTGHSKNLDSMNKETNKKGTTVVNNSYTSLKHTQTHTHLYSSTQTQLQTHTHSHTHTLKHKH